MKMVGHRTESIYRRYAIVDEAMLKEGAAKLQILHDTQQSPASNVVRLADAKRLGSSSGRVARPKREKIGPATRGKWSKSGGKNMVGRTGLNRRHQDFQSYSPVFVSARNCLMWNTRVTTVSCAGVCWNNQECA